jgi:hypothetical protein
MSRSFFGVAFQLRCERCGTAEWVSERHRAFRPWDSKSNVGLSAFAGYFVRIPSNHLLTNC